MSAALEVAREALRGERAWVVGGAVRDRLLGRPVLDLDVAVAGDPRTLARHLAPGGLAVPITTLLLPRLIDTHAVDPQSTRSFVTRVFPTVATLWAIAILPVLALLPALYSRHA